MPGHALKLAGESSRLLTCVHCGFCLPACPTYTLLGDENDSPRGRILLMRAVAEGRLPVTGAFETHIDRCLGCRACESACPAGVEFGALLESARQDRRAVRGHDPGAAGSGWLGWLTGRRRAGLVYALGRTARRTGVARALGRLPGRPGLLGRLLAASASHVGGRELVREKTRASAGAGTRASSRAPGGADRRPQYALLEGCVMRGLFPHVHAAARRSLAASGFGEVRIPGQVCCGALHAHSGQAEAAAALARRNIEAFEHALEGGTPNREPKPRAVAAKPLEPEPSPRETRDPVPWLAVDSAGCGAALREYPSWLRADRAWQRRAERLAARVRDVTELLADPPSPVRGRLEGRAAYDAPCHLLHGQGIGEAPLRMLERIDGLVLHPLPSSDRCCGGAGIYNLLQPQISRAVLEPKLSEIAAGEFDWVLTGNPGCVMQIGAGLRERRIATRAAHPVELLDRALARSGGQG